MHQVFHALWNEEPSIKLAFFTILFSDYIPYMTVSFTYLLIGWFGWIYPPYARTLDN